MSSNPSKKYSKSISGKVLVAILLAGLAIFSSWLITRITFTKILGTVNKISRPNEKLKLVNDVFKDVIRLDQLQRAQSINNSVTTYNPYLKESKQLQDRLDTLRGFVGKNDVQAARIDSMKLILNERDKLFLNYLKLRANLVKNDTLTQQIRTLSQIITNASANTDSSVVTTEKKITTTTLQPVDSSAKSEDGSKGSFWDRLLGRKKEREAAKVQRLIVEELNIKIDTLALAKEDSLMQRLSETITNVEAERTDTRNVLITKQMQLIRAGNELVSALFSILQDIETEELHNSEMDSRTATDLANANINRINLVLIIFIVGSGLLIFLIFTDIARSNQYRSQLIAAKEEAEQLTQVKQRFLSNMSHELRTPLQTIIGFAEQMKGKDDVTQDEVNIIYQSSKHLLQTVNEVLDYSRITSGKFTFVSASFNLYQTLTEVTEAIRIEAIKKGLKFDTEIEVSPQQEYLGDPFRIKQILYNLLGNAIKFTASGIVSVKVSGNEQGGRTAFVFEVHDTGIGIPESDIDRIFNQFEQSGVVKNNTVEGTGLGLAIVKELVEGMQGSIDVHSTEGFGSTFTIQLSLAKAKEARETKQQPAGNIQLNFAGTVWVVDDDPYILQLCKTIFEKNSIDHICFPDPNALLNYEYNEPPTLIFTDIRMPGITGIELCKELKERDEMKGVKIVALTAQALPSEDQQQANDCFDDMLMKPFLEEHMLQVLAEYSGLPQNTVKAEPAAVANDGGAFANVIKMTDGEPELLLSILSTFIQETTGDIAALQQATKENDASAVRNYLHKLAGRCGQTGAGDISKEARRLEIDIAGSEELLTTHINAIHTLVPKIQQLIIEAQTLCDRYSTT
ncbi:MAG: response regulator [Sphingobacteriales bacterium]|nr:MAG: response regulator [Sphingobacteriales bacterium]